jgi:hypothetical protein
MSGIILPTKPDNIDTMDQDQLGQALQKRPTAEELVKDGILQRKALTDQPLYATNVFPAEEAPAA